MVENTQEHIADIITDIGKGLTDVAVDIGKITVDVAVDVGKVTKDIKELEETFKHHKPPTTT